MTRTGDSWPAAPPARTFRPTVFRGLWCRCGAGHAQEARYYVSVRESDGGRWRPVLGPFQEHDEALARVDAVRAIVLAKYDRDGRAHWYSFGTVSMKSTYSESGVLNASILGEENVR